MDMLTSFFHFCLQSFKDPIFLIQTVGYLGLIAIIFAETGLLVGFFLPGDSLLIAAGIFAYRQEEMQLSALLFLLTAAAIVGDAVGFYIGKKLGLLLYEKKDSFFFRKAHLISAQSFYQKHGGKTIIIARFLPLLRTFAPTVAGAASMSYFRFVIFNIVGAFLWVWTLVLGGYYLGKTLGDKLNDSLHFIIFGIILVSFIPLFLKWLQSRRSKN
jgi:membrane-associated protein